MYNSTSQSSAALAYSPTSVNHVGKTKGWEENLELKIRMPLDLMGGPLGGVSSGVSAAAFGGQTPLTESECKIYLIVTLRSGPYSKSILFVFSNKTFICQKGKFLDISLPGMLLH